MAEKERWKVGDLAKVTGITVRALHHYDQIGLLVTSLHSDAGHRLYSGKDIARLQQIISLKQLGFSLDEIGELLGNPSFRPDKAIRMQLERLVQQIRIQEDLRSRLEHLYEQVQAQRELTGEEWIKIIEVMKMTEKYFTPEQMEKLKKQGELLGAEKIKEVENEWPSLIANVRVELEKGTPPENPEVQLLAKRWKELVNLFTGGDSGITRSAERYYAENPERAAEFGMDKELWQYISKAMATSLVTDDPQ
nr:MerR family transcriptional regulator [Ferroacidibacillus organovorans]